MSKPTVDFALLSVNTTDVLLTNERYDRVLVATLRLDLERSEWFFVGLHARLSTKDLKVVVKAVERKNALRRKLVRRLLHSRIG